MKNKNRRTRLHLSVCAFASVFLVIFLPAAEAATLYYMDGSYGSRVEAYNLTTGSYGTIASDASNSLGMAYGNGVLYLEPIAVSANLPMPVEGWPMRLNPFPSPPPSGCLVRFDWVIGIYAAG